MQGQVRDPYLLKDQQTFSSLLVGCFEMVRFKLSIYARDFQHSYFSCTLTITKTMFLLELRTYVNQLSIAPITNVIHRVTPFQSRHIHDLCFVCPVDHQSLYAFSPHTLNLWLIL